MGGGGGDSFMNLLNSVHLHMYTFVNVQDVKMSYVHSILYMYTSYPSPCQSAGFPPRTPFHHLSHDSVRGARWPWQRPFSRNVAVENFFGPWQIGGRKGVRKNRWAVN